MQRCTSSRALVAIMVLALVAWGIGLGVNAMRSHSPVVGQADQGQLPESSAAPGPEGQLTEAQNPGGATQPVQDVRPQPPPVAASKPPAQPAEVASALRQLFPGLGSLDLSRGPMSKDQAEQMRNGLEILSGQGASAVPRIRQFLEMNVDFSFGKSDAGATNPPSLRAGLLESLRQIGGADAQELSKQLLQSSTDPLEIALASRNLNEAAPGQYRADALGAARQALAQVAEAAPGAKDPCPLFQVLQTYGDASVVTDLEALVPKWNYYATLALAGLPSGEGIPSLIGIAQDPASLETGRYKLALLMLAQASSQYPSAATGLVDMARQGQIPDDAWQQLVAGFGPREYQLARELPQNTVPPGALVETGQSQIGGATQTFYSTPLSPDKLAAAANARVALIDQLLAIGPSPAAVEALTQARQRLTGGAR